MAAPPAAVEVRSPLTGVVVEVAAAEGDLVAEGAPLVLVEAMKMHHEVLAPAAGVLRGLAVAPGAQVREGEPLCRVEAVQDGAAGVTRSATPASGGAGPRADLERVLARRRALLDEARPAAVSRRRRTGLRTARENVAALCDPGTFSEYGGLALAAQRARHSEDELIARTPADGLVAGIGAVGGVRCVVLAYDYTVLAGTQGVRSHRKADRMLALAERWRLPVVLFAEGGGGRPGDTDQSELFHLVVPTFQAFARLSGLVPRIGIASGRCFAGNAALLGCCDVVIATPDASIGMGGPAMIEGGGLGSYAPEEVGPAPVLAAAGAVDVLADDEAGAVAAAQAILACLGGTVERWEAADQAALRDVVPEDPKRVHDARRVLELLADTGSVIELRRAWGRGMITALARLKGRPVGVLANDPSHRSGALDAEGAEKAARFLQLCDAHGLPVVSLVDTPGFMVGPESEAAGMVRRCSRLFVTAATLGVPWITVIVRRAYGLGAQAMAGGAFHAPVATLAWPTGEFGAMGVEGAVRLAARRELEEIADEAAREARVAQLAAEIRARSGALDMAAHFEVDDVIDPADTRARVGEALRAAPVPPSPPSGRRRTMVDTW